MTERKKPGPKPMLPAENRLPAIREGAHTEVLTASTDIQTKIPDALEDAVSFGDAVGVMRMADFVETVSSAARAAAYEKAKKTKSWKFLKDKAGNAFPNLDAVCHHFLGYSDRRHRQLTESRNTLGQELFEQAEALGLRQVDYNVIKSLPPSDKALVEQAISAQSRDEVVGLLQEMAVKHHKEKEGLTKERDDAVANYIAKDGLHGEDKKKLEALQLAARKQKVALTDWPAAFEGYIAQVQEAHRAVKSKLGALDLIREQAMQLEPAPGEAPALEHARQMLAVELVHIHNACADYLEALGLSFDKTLGAFCEERIRMFGA